MDELRKRDSTLADQSAGSTKKDRKRGSGSPSPGRTPKSKRNSSRKSPLNDEGFTLDTPQNNKFASIELGSEATKIGSTSSNMRKDYYGNLISKGPYKKQKLTWADKVGDTSVPTVITVESYKKYNVDVSADRADCNCACYIF